MSLMSRLPSSVSHLLLVLLAVVVVVVVTVEEEEATTEIEWVMVVVEVSMVGFPVNSYIKGFTW